jgi:hypothetical protein
VVTLGQKDGWVSPLVWIQRLDEKFFASDGDRALRPIVQSVEDSTLTDIPLLDTPVSKY